LFLDFEVFVMSGELTTEPSRSVGKVNVGELNTDLGEKNVDLLKNVTVRKHKKSRPKGVTDVVTQSTLDSSYPPVQVDGNISEGYVEPVPNAANARIGVTTSGLVNLNEVTNTESLIKMKHDYIVALFGVSLSTLEDINEFTLSCEVGKYPVWVELDSNARAMAMDAIEDLWNAFVAEIKAKYTTPKPTDESPIVQAVDINTNGTSSVGATGLRDAQPIIDTSFRPPVAEPVFEGVNISIPRKVVEKVSTRLEHTLYGYFIGNRMAFPVVENNARNN
jgi:hypothetical protein